MVAAAEQWVIRRRILAITRIRSALEAFREGLELTHVLSELLQPSHTPRQHIAVSSIEVARNGTTDHT